METLEGLVENKGRIPSSKATQKLEEYRIGLLKGDSLLEIEDHRTRVEITSRISKIIDSLEGKSLKKGKKGMIYARKWEDRLGIAENEIIELEERVKETYGSKLIDSQIAEQILKHAREIVRIGVAENRYLKTKNQKERVENFVTETDYSLRRISEYTKPVSPTFEDLTFRRQNTLVVEKPKAPRYTPPKYRAKLNLPTGVTSRGIDESAKKEEIDMGPKKYDRRMRHQESDIGILANRIASFVTGTILLVGAYLIPESIIKRNYEKEEQKRLSQVIEAKQDNNYTKPDSLLSSILNWK